jgi:protein-S-isoprenylcysteine O-methyltransferase Ste14
MALQEQLKRQSDYLFKYRGYLPIIFLVFALVARGHYIHYGSNNSAVISSISTFMESIALYVGLFGVLLRLYTVDFTPKNTSGRNISEGRIADELNTKGLYSLTRNPLYVGIFFMWMGLVFYIGVILFFLLYMYAFDLLRKNHICRGSLSEKKI